MSSRKSLKAEISPMRLLRRDRVIRDLSRNYSADDVRNALIRQWAKCNNVSLKEVAQATSAAPIMSDGNPSAVLEVERLIASSLKEITLKDLERAFEDLIDPNTRRETGTVLTPEYIIDCLIRTGLNFASRTQMRRPKICDIACGYGGFLIRAAEILFKDYGLSYTEAFRHCIVGIDNNERNIRFARIMVELFLIMKGIDPKSIPISIYQMDTLTSTPEAVVRRTDATEGFDLVTTNPPYIKIQNLTPDYRSVLTGVYPDFTHGSFSTAPLFLIAGERLLCKGGCLAFITQNNLYTSLSGKPIRQHIQQRQSLRRIVDFGHKRVFENASAYTCLMFLGSTPSPTFQYCNLKNDPNASNISKCEFSTLEHRLLNPSKWRLSEKKHLANLRKIEAMPESLGSAFEIRVGFATLKDAVYFVEETQQGVQGRLPNGDVAFIERDITRLAAKLPDFKTEKELHANRVRIIFPYHKSAHGRYIALNEIELQKRFPMCHEYLLHWREFLATRDKGKREIHPWFAWARTQSMEAPGPKLLTKTFNRHPHFLMDHSDQLFCNGYGVFPKRAESLTLFPRPPLGAIQRLLNSSLMHYYTILTSFQIEGGYQCYQKNFIERFGLFSFSCSDADVIDSLTDDELDLFFCKQYQIPLEDIHEVVRGETNQEVDYASHECEQSLLRNSLG